MDRDGKQEETEGARKLLEAELLVTVGHELRSPLTAIKGYASTLLRHGQRLSETEQQEYLTAIQDASSRLEYVIDRLLEIGQFEQGAIRLERMLTDVPSLAREAMRAAESRAVGKTPNRFSFQLQVRDSAGLPTQEAPLVLADPLRLREVLDHLLENAMTYSPEGGRIDVMIFPVQLASVEPRVAEHAKEAVASFISTTARFTQADGKEPYEVLEMCV